MILIFISYFIYPEILLGSNDRLQVFFECPDGCPKTEVMNEIKFVDFINTKDKADIHVKFISINISHNMMKEEILFFLNLKNFLNFKFFYHKDPFMFLFVVMT